MRKWPPLPKVVKGAVSDYAVTEGTQDSTNAGEKVITENNAELRITTAIPIEMRWQTFFHELIHKWEEEGEFKLKDTPGNSDVNRLATAMFADYKRNDWKLPGEK